MMHVRRLCDLISKHMYVGRWTGRLNSHYLAHTQTCRKYNAYIQTHTLIGWRTRPFILWKLSQMKQETYAAASAGILLKSIAYIYIEEMRYVARDIGTLRAVSLFFRNYPNIIIYHFDYGWHTFVVIKYTPASAKIYILNTPCSELRCAQLIGSV